MVGVGLVVVVGSRDAAAATLGALATSTGVMAMLVAIFAIKGWPAVVSAEAASAAGGALLLTAVAAWVAPTAIRARRSRATEMAMASPDLAALTARGLDADGLRSELAQLFCQVQHAWDEAELTELRDRMTPEMLNELMQERTHCLASPGVVRTRIVTVDAELLDYEELPEAAILTVTFSGSMCEGCGRLEAPFRELWMLMRPTATAGRWKLARHQTLY